MNPKRKAPPIDDLNSAATELYLSADYFQYKADECRDIINHLLAWSQTPNCTFEFSIEGQPVSTFKIGPADGSAMQAIFMSLAAYYQRKATEERGRLEQLKGGGVPLADLARFQE